MIYLLKLSSLSIQAPLLLSFFPLGVIRFGFAIVALAFLIISTFFHPLWYFYVQVIFVISSCFLARALRIIVEISRRLARILKFD
jgi:hypothetical protein